MKFNIKKPNVVVRKMCGILVYLKTGIFKLFQLKKYFCKLFKRVFNFLSFIKVIKSYLYKCYAIINNELETLMELLRISSSFI